MSEDIVATMQMLKAAGVEMEFSGTYAELQDDVKLTGIYGEWRDLRNHKQFRADNGAILNWWQLTGAITFQGPSLAAEEFQAKLFDAIGGVKAFRAGLVESFLEELFAKVSVRIPE